MFSWSNFLSFYISPSASTLIKLRKLSILASKYAFCGQNKLNDTQLIVYARVRASFLDNLGCMTLMAASKLSKIKRGGGNLNWHLKALFIQHVFG